MFGTFVDLIETLKFVEVQALHQLDELDGRADERLDRVRRAPASRRCFGQRAGVRRRSASARPRSLGLRDDLARPCRGPPMLPGLSRTQCGAGVDRLERAACG